MNKFFKLKKLIDKYDIISFDIFDTLIKRNCLNPTDIFKIVELKYNKKYEKKISNFFNNRIKAEQYVKNTSNSEEITLDMIYSAIDYDVKVRNILKKLEISTELELCQKNAYISDIYEYCVKKKKKIICISNMYLSKDDLKKILSNCKYEINDVFVSSEYGVKKQTGNLFRKVLEILNIKSSKILHIGDDFKADWFGSRKAKIKSYIIKNKHKISLTKKFKKNINLTTNIMLSTILNNIDNITNDYEKIGFEILGPIMVQMAYWINKKVIENNYNNLLFCSRDMKLMKEVYDNLINDKKVSTHYFYVSRKSMYLPYLSKFNDYEHFKGLQNENQKVKITELLSMIKLKISNNTLKKYGLNCDKKYKINELLNDNNFKKLYYDVISDYITTEGNKQYSNLISYLNTLSVNDSTVIIDLGWRGSIQKCIDEITNYSIDGLYFGLLDNKIIDNCHAYLFKDNDSEYCKKIYFFIEVFELIFSATHGSTFAYSNDKKQPYLLNASKNNNNKYIDSIHIGVLKYLNKINKYKEILEYNDDKVFINKLMDIGINPPLKIANTIGKMYSENFFSNYVAYPKKFSYYIFHITELKKDFSNSVWKIGFAKNLLKIKLPYYFIFKLVKMK